MEINLFFFNLFEKFSPLNINRTLNEFQRIPHLDLDGSSLNGPTKFLQLGKRPGWVTLRDHLSELQQKNYSRSNKTLSGHKLLGRTSNKYYYEKGKSVITVT